MQPALSFPTYGLFTKLMNCRISLLVLAGALLASNAVQAEESQRSAVADSKATLTEIFTASSEKAIGGTGRATKAIGGTGRATKAIGGTGRTTKAIGGTGRTTKAIGGTGRTTKAIGGTGRTTKAIGGTGRTTKAIGGTGRITKAIGDTGRFTKSVTNGSASLDTPLIRGAIEGWDSTHRTLQVLGQQIHVEGDESFTVGAIAVIEGSLDGTGKIVADYAWSDTSELYVPGSSDVVITGRVTSVDSGKGTLAIGSLAIDYTQLLWDAAFTPAVGTFITVVGSQAIPNGTLQAREAVIR